MKKIIVLIIVLNLITSPFFAEAKSGSEYLLLTETLAPLLRSPHAMGSGFDVSDDILSDPRFLAIGRSIFSLLVEHSIKKGLLEKKLRDDLAALDTDILAAIDFSTVKVEGDHVFFTYMSSGQSPLAVEIFLPDEPLPSSPDAVRIGDIVIRKVIQEKGGYAINLTGGELSPEEHETINRAVHFSIMSGDARTLFEDRPPILSGDKALKKDSSDNEFYRDLRSLRHESSDGDVLIEYDPEYIDSAASEIDERFLVLTGDQYLKRFDEFSALESRGAVKVSALLDVFPSLNPEDRKGAYKAIIASRNYKALRAVNRSLSDDFEVVIADINSVYKGGNIVFHPGNRRNTTYISRDYLKALSVLYSQLTPDNKADIIQIMWEAFFHEDEHSLQYKEMSGSVMEISEEDINSVASSFRVRTFFRVLHSYMETGVKPDLDAFFKRLSSSERKNISYIHAYTHLTLDEHLDMAEKLTRKRPSPDSICGILAQKHLGAVFYNSKPGDPQFERGKKLLSDKKLINKGQETGKIFTVYKFIRELVRQHSFIIMEEPLEEAVIKASSLDEFEAWNKGTQERPGDSVYLPKDKETTAIAVKKDTVIARLRSIEGMPASEITALTALLKETEDGMGTIVPCEVLAAAGKYILKHTSFGVSAAGKGTRYAEVVYSDSGKAVKDKAKGAYKIPLPDAGERALVEILIAQIRHLNMYENLDMSLDLYTSNFTHYDIEQELLHLGYKQERVHQDYLKSTFTHTDGVSPRINMYRVRESLILGGKTGDFYLNVVGREKAINMNLQWPDAHDSTFIDFFVSGSAYLQLKGGNKYRFISNIDNRAGVPDPIVLGLMALTDSALVNEAPLMKGEPGGSLVKFKDSSLPPAFDFGTRKGILEKHEFSPDIFHGMDPHQKDAAIKKYFPLFNSANYTFDIIKFAREAFYPGYSDQAIIDELEKFYEAQRTMDSEKLAELKFSLEERYRKKLQTFERDKTLPFGILVSHLAGSIPWIIKDTLFVEVPASVEGGADTRFEPLKENIYNLRRMHAFVQNRLIRFFGSTVTIDEIVLADGIHSDRDKFVLTDLKNKYKNGTTLESIERALITEVRKYEGIFLRLQSKKNMLFMSPSPHIKGSVKNALHDIFFKNGLDGEPLRTNNNITIRELMKIRDGDFSDTTIRTEVNTLSALGILEKGPLSTGNRYTWKLTERFRELDADIIRQILDIPELDRFEIKKRTDIVRSKIEALISQNSDNYVKYLPDIDRKRISGIIGSDTYSLTDAEARDIQAELDMLLMHLINKSLFDTLFPLPSLSGHTESTLWHVISSDLIPSGMRASFKETIRDINSIPGIHEKIIIYENGQDASDVIGRIKRDDEELGRESVINFALTDTSQLENIREIDPDIKVLIFEGLAGNYNQLEGVIAVLRALRNKDISALYSLYSLLTGDILDIPIDEVASLLDDPLELAKRLKFKLKPINITELRDFNERLKRFLFSA